MDTTTDASWFNEQQLAECSAVIFLSTTGDVLDAVADTVQAELNSQLLEVESRELKAIDDAIERLDAGEFGDCQGCGKAIPLSRLRAVPYATECIDCHRLKEKKKSHPSATINRVFDSQQSSVL